MADPKTLRDAIIAIAEDDDDSGGVVDLLDSKANPLVRWGTSAASDKPISAIQIIDAEIEAPTESEMAVGVRISTAVPGGKNGLETTVNNRYEVIISTTALAARGIDAAVFHRRRRSLSDLEQGGQREDMEFDVLMER